MRLLLVATRVWLPLAIAIAGVVLIVIGGPGSHHHSPTAAAAGVALLIAALIVWMVNWLFRMSVQSNRERERGGARARVLRPPRPLARRGTTRLASGLTAFTLMGVVNVTPDSFSDGGRYFESNAAIAHGLELELEGAAILDIGGESTRPGADPVGAEEELRRVLPVIDGLVAAGCKARISVDTSKSEVAAEALAAGASYVNDVTAFRGDPELADVVASSGADCCLMHMLGDPRTMQDDPRYDDVVSEVREFLEERVAFALARGIERDRIMLDPGIGFGKTLDHNLELLRRLDELVAIGRPLVIGTSRKSFLGRITGRGPDERVAATVATNVLAYERGARVFRVHDVAPVRDALAVTAATVTARWPTPTISTTTT